MQGSRVDYETLGPCQFDGADYFDRPEFQLHSLSSPMHKPQNMTPWFDAKLHSPVREGWYDCQECNARHYWKDGLWYRNRKSIRYGRMIIEKMHWRGLTMTGLADTAKGAADRAGAAIDDAMAFIAASNKRIAAKESGAAAGRDRTSLESLLAQCDPSVPRSKEEQEWLDMAPVGREFGSPDFERLMEEDAKNLQVNLTRLVNKCRGCYDPEKDPLDKKMRKDAVNVQAALKELGLDVTVKDAASVWVRHSNSMCAGWMAGAETVKRAKLTLIAYCAFGTDDFIRGVEDQSVKERFDADIRRSLKVLPPTEN